MLLAILSDSHDHEPNLRTALGYCAAKGITELLHCGDVAGRDTLELLAKNFRGTAHVVAGNADYDPGAFTELANAHPSLHFYGEVGQLTTPEGKIAWCHHPPRALELARTGRYQAVFHGHTHTPWEQRVGDCPVINPGTLAGTYSRATFAVYDTATRTAKLIVLDQLNPLFSSATTQ